MTIQTPRLLLREPTFDDFDLLLPILSDPVTMSFWPAPFTEERIRAWIERSIASHAEHRFGRWIIVSRESGEVMGDCGVMRSPVDGVVRNDLGYIVHHRHWGSGYATEAARGVMEDAFTRLGLEDLHANMPQDHHASRRVAERIGMRRAGEFINTRNRDIPTFLYTIGMNDPRPAA
jgi:RimJ/RimL family protein N-acetyltransferase